MVTFTIYELPGIKVGCTTNLRLRGRSWRLDERYNNVCVLETIKRELDNEESWQLAGDHEIWWQMKLGYELDDVHYSRSRKSTSSKNMHRARLRGNRHVVELGKCGFNDPSVSREAGLLGSKRVNELGKGGFQKRMTCEHCGLEGSNGAMHRWHGDNCKYKPKG